MVVKSRVKSTEENGYVQAIITDRGTVVTGDILKQYEITPPETKQVESKQWQAQIIEPPYDLVKLMQWHNINIIHSSCVRVKVQDAVGIGYHLEPEKDPETGLVPDLENDPEYKMLEKFLRRVNAKESLTMVLKKVFFDYESCGNAYIEVSRDIKGNINGLYHVNATTVRWCKDKQTLIQRAGDKFVYFKLFGEKQILNKVTGKFGVQVDKPENVANEIIPVVQYTWMSSCYGLPEWLPSLSAMFGDMKENEYTIDFFLNYGVPAYAILVEGAKISPTTLEEIDKYFETTLKGSNHKTLTLTSPVGGTIKFERLSVEQKEASFRIYKKDNRMDVLAAHRVPPYRVGVVEQGQLGGDVSRETDKIYLESVINPRQEEFMWVVNNLIIREGFDIHKWNIEFDDINVENKKVDSEIYGAYIDKGVMTPNEVRAKLGLKPYKGGDAFYVSSMLIPSGLSPDAGEEEVDSLDVTCSNCGKKFDWIAETEVKQGWVKCPECGWQVNQEGRAVEKTEGVDSAKKRFVKKAKIIPDAEAQQAQKEYLSKG